MGVCLQIEVILIWLNCWLVKTHRNDEPKLQIKTQAVIFIEAKILDNSQLPF